MVSPFDETSIKREELLITRWEYVYGRAWKMTFGFKSEYQECIKRNDLVTPKTGNKTRDLKTWVPVV
ncbi:MAG: hypothetical protein CM15mP85_04730 [Rhodobacterales bacterium]|nr:MAG: hypothetical protein CM15mP85_04730 [Rhodobacterales bacterium]